MKDNVAKKVAKMIKDAVDNYPKKLDESKLTEKDAEEIARKIEEDILKELEKEVKFEPLEGKEWESKIGKFYYEEDVKSAVLGLLEKIRDLEEQYKKIVNNPPTEKVAKYVDGIIAGLGIAEEQIKRWFPDVVGDENGTS